MKILTVLSIYILGAQLISPTAASSAGRAVLVLETVNLAMRENVIAIEKSEETDAGDENEETGVSDSEEDEHEQPSNEPSRYVVENGDTLSAIAEDFGISVSTLASANGLTSRSTLKLGQELVILPIDGVQHTVLRGETVSHIAAKYKSDVDEIITFNNIEGEGLIKPGQKIIVPGASPTVSTGASLAVASKSSASGGSIASSRAAANPNPPVDVAGYFIYPVQGKITQGLHFLNAVDMGGSAYCGTPVKAAAGGKIITVANSGWNGGYGNYVKIAHPNGTETIYAHNARNIVVSGQEVAQGEVIAYMGSTGNSTGCHVHFAVRGAGNPFARR